jgi:uncharacterized protein YndB with AHSA1/START domain
MTDAPFELAIERYIDAPPDRVFRVWTERTAEWWAPKPWTTEIVAQDLRPGGRQAMIMRGLDGATSPMEGVFLEIIPNRSIVFTDAFTVGWVPKVPFMIGFFAFTPEGAGTRYLAGARHWDAEAYERHAAMGFEQGWSIVAEQLAALAEGS